MIIGHMDRPEEFPYYPEPIRRALDYLRKTDLAGMKAGSYELEGKDLFVLIQEYETGAPDTRKPEAHEQYIDIQYIISGKERIGAAVAGSSSRITEDLRPETDLLFYRAPEGESWVELAPGGFAVFFPSDIHRPCCQSGSPGPVRKAVVKIRYSLLTPGS